MAAATRGGSRTTLAALRRATAADHQSVDHLIDPDRLVEIGYYAAVMGGLIEAAEIIEVTLPLIPRELWRQGVSSTEFSKRAAIDAESAFLDDLIGSQSLPPSPGEHHVLVGAGPPLSGTTLGLLYVYVGSALGGLHLLRVARTAPWWRHDREPLLLRPYGRHLTERWQTVLDALERLDLGETDAAVLAARAVFDVHRRSLIDHLSLGRADG